jgi:Ala-tRNA(Pro) deacylase
MNFLKALSDQLQTLSIGFEVLEHEAFHTVEATLGEYEKMGIPENKSLFMRDEKKKRFFLVVMAGEKRADLKALAQRFNEKRLSFCSEQTLVQKLNTTPGAVSPFGLMLESATEIEVLLDEDLLRGSHVGFHPNLNTQTWKISTDDFKIFLSSLPQTITLETL